MAIKKMANQIKLKSTRIYVAFAILIIIAMSFLLRLTPLVTNFSLNFITALVVKNGVGLFVIASLLIAIHIVDLMRFKEILEKEDQGNVISRK